jgi:4-hydroxybenzoate polyprenyltransferase
MSRPSRPHGGQSPVVAGSLLIATLLLCAGVGAGLGSLIGAIAPLTIAGVFVGFAAGLAVVVNRFRDV